MNTWGDHNCDEQRTTSDTPSYSWAHLRADNAHIHDFSVKRAPCAFFGPASPVNGLCRERGSDLHHKERNNLDTRLLRSTIPRQPLTNPTPRCQDCCRGR